MGRRRGGQERQLRVLRDGRVVLGRGAHLRRDRGELSNEILAELSNKNIAELTKIVAKLRFPMSSAEISCGQGWRELAPMLEARANFGACATDDGAVVVAGGEIFG